MYFNAYCAKMAEPVNMQFVMLSQVGPENTYYTEMQRPHRKGHFGASGRLKSIVKQRILGLGKRVSCAKKWVDQS